LSDSLFNVENDLHGFSSKHDRRRQHGDGPREEKCTE